jgi:hypothetical protein
MRDCACKRVKPDRELGIGFAPAPFKSKIKHHRAVRLLPNRSRAYCDLQQTLDRIRLVAR